MKQIELSDLTKVSNGEHLPKTYEPRLFSEAAKEAQRRPLRSYVEARKFREGHGLTVPQLCDLLNYIYQLPVVDGERTVYPEMSGIVVKSWTLRVRRQVEIYCEAKLRLALQKEIPAHWAGKRAASFPTELNRWVPWKAA